MKIAYYTHETISSGLFRTQVKDVVEALAAQGNGDKYTIYVYNYFWTLVQNFALVRSLKKELSNLGIEIRIYPFLVPVKYSLASHSYFKFLKIFFQLMIFFTFDRKADIHHARGYLLTYALVKNKLSSVIFDMRSLWILENISAGNLKPETKLAEAWFELERVCVSLSAFNVGVSAAMGDYVSKISADANFKLIPISVVANYFQFDADMREKIRTDNGWQESLIMVYSGSLGLSRINLEPLQSLFKVLKREIPDLKGIVISEDSKKLFVELFEQAHFQENDYLITSAKQASLAGVLSAADFGVHALPRQLDFKTRLGTKVVEYFMNGLPVIVNKNVGDAGKLIREKNLGYVLDYMSSSDFHDIKNTGIDWRFRAGQASADFARNTFASEVIVKMYYSLYMAINVSSTD